MPAKSPPFPAFINRDARLCPECQQWQIDSTQFFARDSAICKVCAEAKKMVRKAQQQRQIALAAAKTLAAAGDKLRSLPQGEETIRAAFEIIGGPFAAAKGLVELLSETNSGILKFQIYKLLISGSMEIERNKPKADLGSLSDSELQDLINARMQQAYELARKSLAAAPPPLLEDDTQDARGT